MMSNGTPPARPDDAIITRWPWLFPQERAPSPPRDEGCTQNGLGDPAPQSSNGSPPTPSPPSKSTSPSRSSTSPPRNTRLELRLASLAEDEAKLRQIKARSAENDVKLRQAEARLAASDVLLASTITNLVSTVAKLRQINATSANTNARLAEDDAKLRQARLAEDDAKLRQARLAERQARLAEDDAKLEALQARLGMAPSVHIPSTTTTWMSSPTAAGSTTLQIEEVCARQDAHLEALMADFRSFADDLDQRQPSTHASIASLDDDDDDEKDEAIHFVMSIDDDDDVEFEAPPPPLPCTDTVFPFLGGECPLSTPNMLSAFESATVPPQKTARRLKRPRRRPCRRNRPRAPNPSDEATPSHPQPMMGGTSTPTTTLNATAARATAPAGPRV